MNASFTEPMGPKCRKVTMTTFHVNKCTIAASEAKGQYPKFDFKLMHVRSCKPRTSNSNTWFYVCVGEATEPAEIPRTGHPGHLMLTGSTKASSTSVFIPIEYVLQTVIKWNSQLCNVNADCDKILTKLDDDNPSIKGFCSKTMLPGVCLIGFIKVQAYILEAAKHPLIFNVYSDLKMLFFSISIK